MMVMIMIVLIVILDRPQEMLEGPLGYALALLPRLNVREGEMYALVNSGNHHVIGSVGETAILASLLNRLGNRGCHRKSHLVCAEEATKNPGYRAGHIVRAGSVVRIRRSHD